nr:transcriptional activator FtrA [Klebsiella pneumoniae]
MSDYFYLFRVFVLAAAGLLNGRRATTHWRYTAALQSRFPQIRWWRTSFTWAMLC